MFFICAMAGFQTAISQVNMCSAENARRNMIVDAGTGVILSKRDGHTDLLASHSGGLMGCADDPEMRHSRPAAIQCLHEY